MTTDRAATTPPTAADPSDRGDGPTAAGAPATTGGAFSARGKPKRSLASLSVERRYKNVITLFLSGQLPNFGHERHLHVANILRHLPFGRELMHLGLQTMAYRHFVPDKYRPDITDFWWERLDGTLPDPAAFADLPGGADGRTDGAGPCAEAGR